MVAWSKAVVAYWIIFIQYKHHFFGSRMRVRGLRLGFAFGLGLVGVRR